MEKITKVLEKMKREKAKNDKIQPLLAHFADTKLACRVQEEMWKMARRTNPYFLVVAEGQKRHRFSIDTADKFQDYDALYSCVGILENPKTNDLKLLLMTSHYWWSWKKISDFQYESGSETEVPTAVIRKIRKYGFFLSKENLRILVRNFNLKMWRFGGTYAPTKNTYVKYWSIFKSKVVENTYLALCNWDKENPFGQLDAKGRVNFFFVCDARGKLCRPKNLEEYQLLQIADSANCRMR